MSAYGNTLAREPSPLQSPSRWKPTGKHTDDSSLVVFHVPSPSTLPEELATLMYTEFAAEVDRGNTYPQESIGEGGYSKEQFEAYFFSSDLFVGLSEGGELLGEEDAQDISLESVKGDRKWDEVFLGSYYVKPNYPGRSSHICNAGFVVSHHNRGGGFGKLLARSYLHYAPLLGYEASVFNLVYVNNEASVKIWDDLGFQRAGLIPRAGRLKKRDGDGDEYVDAIVYYKSFR